MPLTDLFKQKRNILIATGTKNNSDVIFGALSLHLALEKAEIENTLLKTNFESKLWKDKLNLTDENHKYSIKLPNNSEIKNVIWEPKTNQIILKGHNLENIPPLTVSNINKIYDLLIFIGNEKSINYKTTSLDKKTYLKIDKLLILSKGIFLNLKEINLKKIKGFSALIYTIINETNLEIDEEISTFLLAGIISSTSLFRKNVNKDLFLIINDLINKGADYLKAYKLGTKPLSLSKIHLLSKIFQNTKKIAPNIYLGGTDIEKDTKLDFSEILKSSEIFDAELSLVYIKLLNKTKIYFKNVNNKYNMKDILKKFKGKGNNTQGLIITKDYQNTLNEIFKELNIVIKENNVRESNIVFKN